MSESTTTRRAGTTVPRHTRRFGLGVAIAMLTTLLGGAPTQAVPPPVARIGMICTPGTAAAGTRTFHLVANSGSIDTPDGNSVFLWSFANVDPPQNSHFQTPGPILCVTEGETVVVHLHDSLPEAVSIVFPGQEGVTASGGVPGLMTTEAPPSGDVAYSFVAGHPGTYAYESGSDISKQLEMGLYGALIVRPAIGAGYAYDANTRFDPAREYLVLLNELDPELHRAVEIGTTYDATTLHNRYFGVNGRQFPDTLQDNASPLLPNQPYGALVRIQPYDATTNSLPALIRIINVGELNHPYHPHGNHMTQIAQDGRQLLSPTGGSASSERFGETIGSGQTQDYLLSWNDLDHWNPTTHKLPVSQPNYRNLTFKDGHTWYSGSPYLGYAGTLPTGTITQNVCGEWYFPWHSHALNEFTNFDEGFGGMATLLRVDPLGGCLAFPTSTKLLAGTLKSGGYSALGAADASFYQINSTTTGTRAVDWYAGFKGVPAGALNFQVTYQGLNCGPGATTSNLCPTTTAVNVPQQTIRICNWTVAGATGCSTPTSAGWQSLPAPLAQAVPRSTTLTGAISATDTSLTVASATGSPTGGKFYIRIDNEVMQVTAVSGSTFTVVRHQLGTTAAAHLAGATVASEVATTWTIAGSPAAYVGTGSYKGQVRMLIHTQRGGTTAFSTWANLLDLVYDAP